ncbi:protein kinase family protein [Sphingomonas hylomeconis]|uniref:TonB C-terminal domain-containing protein n=1 Tax=Sphingomonas hylomeconis TaxID=1395958 RepID=A0ABV7T0X8_9SPHN|nr:hypothetical protein [Sphingomonas hylomeconis]
MVIRGILLSALSTLPIPALAQQQSPPPAQRDIIVTAMPLERTEALLRDCLARQCPPKEDIDASLAHAENAFVAGDYKTARTTLLASIRRNKKYAATLPVDVSDLMRAQSRVAVHLGEKASYLSSTRDVVATLKAGLPESDSRILDARIAVGDSQAKIGNVNTAVRIYRSVIERAQKYDLGQTASYAQLRIANLFASLAEQDVIYREAADRELAALADLTDPKFARFSGAAKVMLARAAARRGDMTQVDRLVDSLKANAETTPILLYAPPLVPDRLPGSGPLVTTVNRVLTSNVDKQWVDIGFWIGTDGKVSDIEILRESPSLSGHWVEPVKTALIGRRYAPFTPKSARSGMQRVERYTFTAFWSVKLGSRIRSRDPETRIEMIDLTS